MGVYIILFGELSNIRKLSTRYGMLIIHSDNPINIAARRMARILKRSK